MIAEQLIDAQGELLVARALEMALGGNEAAMRMCLDRLIAPRKERPVSFQLPPTCQREGVMNKPTKKQRVVLKVT